MNIRILLVWFSLFLSLNVFADEEDYQPVEFDEIIEEEPLYETGGVEDREDFKSPHSGDETAEELEHLNFDFYQ